MNLGGPQQRWVCVVHLLFCVKTHVKREYSAIFIICHMYVTIFLLVKSSGFRLLWTVAFLFLFLEQANVSSLWISLHYHLLNKSTHKSNIYVCVYTVYWSNIAVYRLTCPVKITMHSWLVTSKYCYLCYLQYFLSCVFQFSWDMK